MKTVAFAALLFVACTADTEQHAHPRPARGSPAPVLAAQDRDFLERAMRGSNAEVAIGGLGAHRAVRADVRAFGQRMVSDHGAIGRQLAAIAARRRVILPTDLGDHQASYDRVVDLHREPFDRQFVQVMIEDHDAAVELFRGEASAGADPEIRAFAAATLPTIQAHLEHARTLRPGYSGDREWEPQEIVVPVQGERRRSVRR